MKKFVVFIICLVMQLSIFTGPSFGAEKQISLNFKDATLGTVLDVLSRKTGRKFITNAHLAQERITLTLRRVPADEALNALLTTYDLYYVHQPNTDIFIIRSKEKGTLITVTKVFFLNYSKAKDLVEVIKPKLTRGGNISADGRTNSLVVTDIETNIHKIGSFIKELDIPTPQVLLEARIVDVKLSDSFRWGIDIYNLYKSDKFWHDPLAKEREAQLGSEREDESIQPEKSYQQLFSHDLTVGSRLRMGIIEDGINIEALIEAVKRETEAKILSNPKILVLNNEVATIDIIEEIPYQEVTIGGTQSIPLVSTEFKEVGIKLKVRPLINKDGTIILNVVPEQSFRTGEEMGGIPVINTSRVSTTFMIKDGETAVIGGLIREIDTVTEHKVPILGDIPILGYFFKKITKQSDRSELTIFITANIVKDIKIEE